jgi:heme/copper-type cytochrome/quinol oxidase subunit 4
MEDKENREAESSKPQVTERTSGYYLGFVLSILFAITLVFLWILITSFFNLTTNQTLILTGIFVLLYLIISPLLIQTKKTREIRLIVTKKLEKPKEKRPEIHKFEYVGSNQTKTYHKKNCRFAKLIKNKFKEHSDSKSFFTNRKYKGCKVCKA